MADSVFKVRVQLLGEDGQTIGEADVQTSADLVFFEDGETFQQKLNSGKLKGADGAKGEKGDTGATGTRGSRWSSGTAITGTSTTATVFPGTGITDALVNDMYLNTSTGNVYRCSVAGAASAAKWIYSGNIKGSKGDTGAAGQDGADGEKGDKGDTGADGTDGATWLFGTSAPASSSGKDGDWYLNTSNWNVYNKASGNWTQKGSIKGATGSQGPKGETGEAGADGADGAKGDKGEKGDTGTRGSTITYGTAITGTNTTGTVFSNSGITSALVNDLYINTSTYNIYRCTTAGAANVAKWAYVGCIKGATGAKGDKGEKGDTGPAGADGDSIKVGTDYESAQSRKLFFKIIE